MCGSAENSGTLFSYVDLESRIPAKHPLRTIRTIVNDALAVLDGDFGELYSEIGRPSIPPEHLLRAMLLQIFYALRSERLLVERLDFDLSFRWFVGLGFDEELPPPHRRQLGRASRRRRFLRQAARRPQWRVRFSR